MKKIVVVGSLNMDSVIELPHMPKGGETISGRSVALIPGGKGANQAYAIGKLGGNVSLIGAVGEDDFGDKLKHNLNSAGVDTSAVEVLKEEVTGQAYITVDDSGENTIVIIAGANGKVTKELIEEHMDVIMESDIVIMQLEIPIETVMYVKQIAVKAGKTLIIDPAPAVKGLPDELWQGVDYIKPNETELEILTGKTINTMQELRAGGRNLVSLGVTNVIVTMGGKGCLLISEDREEFFPADEVKALDTTAAGDCFTAAFALALSEGKDCISAIQFGQKASAITVTRKGAQTSIPNRNEIDI